MVGLIATPMRTAVSSPSVAARTKARDADHAGRARARRSQACSSLGGEGDDDHCCGSGAMYMFHDVEQSKDIGALPWVEGKQRQTVVVLTYCTSAARPISG